MTVTDHTADVPAGGAQVAERATDTHHFRSVLGHYPTGVVAVTAIGSDGRPTGMVVGTFSAVSLEPPLVSFMPSRGSASFKALLESEHFCINVLGDHQEQVCRAFAAKGATDKFAGLRWRPAASGSPILENVVAWIDCDRQSIIEAGDHYIVLGAVRDLDTHPDAPDLPLLFFQGGYGSFTANSRIIPATSDLLGQIQLVDHARGSMERLARELGMECVAVAPVGDDLVRLASAGEPPSGRAPARVGVRLPFEAPMGPLLVAWSDPRTQRRWLARGLPSGREEEHAEHATALSRLRVRGWTISMNDDAFRELDQRVTDAAGLSPEQARDRLRPTAAGLKGPSAYEHDIRPGATYQVRNVSAPVFDARGHVIMYLSLFGFPLATEGSRVLDVVNRLVETASRVTDRLSWAPRSTDTAGGTR
ncbi:flavin reductase [Streptomyces sp. NPDC026665]|uniref:flavin reductase n=1 Tax=Streptomyces sp. NPDC026665 TaxID=3154798 RepID=UPI00340FE8A2